MMCGNKCVSDIISIIYILKKRKEKIVILLYQNFIGLNN